MNYTFYVFHLFYEGDEVTDLVKNITPNLDFKNEWKKNLTIHTIWRWENFHFHSLYRESTELPTPVNYADANF